MTDFNDSEPAASQKLTRNFSDEIKQEDPDSSLGRGLAAKVAYDRHREKARVLREPWNIKLIEAQQGAQGRIPQSEAVLQARSEELANAWERFCKALPEAQRKELIGKKPDLNFLIDSVDEVCNTQKQKNTQTLSGKAKMEFRKLCQKLHDNKGMLKVVPSDDKYFTLLCGTITTVVTATVNQGKIADEIEATLEEVSEDIAYWGDQMQELGNEKMYKYVIELYVVIFEFLTQIFTKWSSKSSFKHVLAGLDDNFVEKTFMEKRRRILVLEKRMTRELEAERHRVQMKGIAQMSHMTEQLLMRRESGSAQETATAAQVLRYLLGANVQKMLEETSCSLQGLPKLLSPTPAVSQMVEGPASSANKDTWDDADDPKDAHDRSGDLRRVNLDISKSLKASVKRLQEHLSAVNELASRANRLEIDTAVQRRVLLWTSRASRDILWIQGPHGVPQPSQNTTTALLLTGLARKSGVHHVIHFCGIQSQSDQRSSPNTRMMSLLLSLSIQLVAMVSEERLAEISELHKNLSDIESGTISFDTALTLFSKLRRAGPQLLLLIVDNIQNLEDQADKAHTAQLLDLIATLCLLDPDEHQEESLAGVDNHDGDRKSSSGDGDQAPRSTETKICFTTDGYMSALAQAAREGLLEKVEYDVEADERIHDDLATLAVGS